MRDGLRAGLSGFVLVACTGLAFAYVQSNLVDSGRGDYGLRISGDQLVLRLEQDASFRITNGADLTALTDSMARWTNVTTSTASVAEGGRFNLANPVDAGASLLNDGLNRVYFAETDTQGRLGSAIAVSFFWVGATGLIVDCDIVFNERLYTFSTTTPANPNQDLGPSTYDLGEIATHEMGHCLGLDHSPLAGPFNVNGLEVSGFSSGDFTHQSTMYPYGTGTIQGRSLAQDDAAGVSLIYPHGTLATTTGTISGRVLDGADFSPVRGAHVVAVPAATPTIPIVGALSDLQEGGAGGEYTLVDLPPGDYYVRIEPMVGTTNPFTEANTFFRNFDTSFPWEFYDGAGESGFDTGTAASPITLAAGQTATGVDFVTNVGAPDPNEPNNVPAGATSTSCEQTVAASIVPKTDVDYYALLIGGTTLLQLDLSASRNGSSLDAVLGLFDAGGAPLGFADDSLGLDPILYVTLHDAGLYYVAVASKGDQDFDGVGGLTVGSYSLAVRCPVPAVAQGTCPGRVLYAVQGMSGMLAVSDTDRDLRYDGQSVYQYPTGTMPGVLTTRRDRGVCLGTDNGLIRTLYDDDGNFTADRTQAIPTGMSDAVPIAAIRRGGAEYLYVGSRYGGAGVIELMDTGGDAMPERTTTFAPQPAYIVSMAIDEAGTLYVFDALFNEVGGILAFRDRDGDGVAEFQSVFVGESPQYWDVAARRPGELFALDPWMGQVDRIVDLNLDGVADQVNVYASGFSMDGQGITIDPEDVVYIVEGDNRVLALPDDDGDGVADRQVQFSPLNEGLSWIGFGAGPPDEVSGPAALRPVAVAPIAGDLLRLTWEDQGPTVPAYNIYEGTLAPPFDSHTPLACHVSGTPDGGGGRFLDIAPSDAGSHYYLITSSDVCGEGSAGRDGAGRRRPLPGATCGPTP